MRFPFTVVVAELETKKAQLTSSTLNRDFFRPFQLEDSAAFIVSRPWLLKTVAQFSGKVWVELNQSEEKQKEEVGEKEDVLCSPRPPFAYQMPFLGLVIAPQCRAGMHDVDCCGLAKCLHFLPLREHSRIFESNRAAAAATKQKSIDFTKGRLDKDFPLCVCVPPSITYFP